jgi:Holliday junction resolvasome RuvABC endonuclease subunit
METAVMETTELPETTCTVNGVEIPGTIETIECEGEPEPGECIGGFDDEDPEEGPKPEDQPPCFGTYDDEKLSPKCETCEQIEGCLKATAAADVLPAKEDPEYRSSPLPAGAADMRILALDLSLTAPGICNPDGTTETLKVGKLRGMKRLAHIRREVRERFNWIDLAVLEGYSFGSRGNSAVSLGELGGVIRLELHDQMIPYVEIPPSCLKKYATGVGSGKKDGILQAAVLRSGHIFGDDNQADAWWLWQAALAHYEPDSPLLVRMPAGNREGLKKVAWPDVRRAA